MNRANTTAIFNEASGYVSGCVGHYAFRKNGKQFFANRIKPWGDGSHPNQQPQKNIFKILVKLVARCMAENLPIIYNNQCFTLESIQKYLKCCHPSKTLRSFLYTIGSYCIRCIAYHLDDPDTLAQLPRIEQLQKNRSCKILNSFIDWYGRNNL